MKEKDLNSRTTPIKMKVLERSPGGYITKLLITEQVNGKKETYNTTYYLEESKTMKKIKDFIKKQINKT